MAKVITPLWIMEDCQQIPKVRDWQKLVRSLKQGPSFGIHGTRFENLDDILSRHKITGTVGHYYAVGDKQKALEDEAFYEILWASINSSLGFSGCFEDRKKNPCLLLGINQTKYSSLNDEHSRRSSHFGKFNTTFEVGHDFIRGWSVEPIVLYGEEKQVIDRIMETYSRITPELKWDRISNSYCYQKLVTSYAFKELCKVMREYRKQ